MIRIILVGCNGKMGKMVTQIASVNPNVSIVAGIDRMNGNSTYPVFSALNECTVDADVILDFSRADALNDILSNAESKKLSVVLCTTGYDEEQLNRINLLSKKIAIFRSANMSIGINVLNNILKNVTAMLYGDYDIEIIEKHHNQKVDSPSGTAILLGNTIKDAISEETVFVHGREGISKRSKKEIGMHAVRGGSIVGEHEVIFAGQGETIELKHTAISREVFAKGAVKACEFMYNKEPGMYNMDDILKY